MKLFRSSTTPAAPVVPREPMTSDPDVLSTVWSAWLTAQPLQSQQSLAWSDRSEADAALAGHLAADPVRKLRRLQADPAMSPEVRALADALLAGDVLGDVPSRLARVAETSEPERRLTAETVRDAVATRMTPEGADALAFVIAFLVGTELDDVGAAPRRVDAARGVIFVGLRALGLPIHTWEPRLIGLEHAPSVVVAAA